MSGRKQTVIKNTFIYIIANFGSKILTFLIVPLYTFYLPVDRLGKYDYNIAFVALLLPIVSLQIYDSVYRWIIGDDDDCERIISNGSFILYLNILISFIFFVFLYKYLGIDDVHLYYATLVFELIYTFYREILRGMKKNMIYAIVGIIYSCTYVALNCILIIYAQMGVSALLYSQIISYAIATIVMVTCLKKLVIVKRKLISLQLIKQMLVYSLPFVPNVISWWIMNLSDRYAIKFFLDENELGLYAISCKFPSLITTLLGLFQLAWQQSAIEERKSFDKENYYSEMFQYVYETVLLASSIFIVLTRIVIKVFFSYEYYMSWKYVPLLYGGAAFCAFANFWGTEYYSNKDTSKILYTTITAALVNILINALFMRQFGTIVASISTFLSYFVLFVIRIWGLRNSIKVIIDWKKFSFLCGINAIAIIIAFIHNSFLEMVSGVVFCLMFLHLIIVPLLLRFMQKKRKGK